DGCRRERARRGSGKSRARKRKDEETPSDGENKRGEPVLAGESTLSPSSLGEADDREGDGTSAGRANDPAVRGLRGAAARRAAAAAAVAEGTADAGAAHVAPRAAGGAELAGGHAVAGEQREPGAGEPADQPQRPAAGAGRGSGAAA